MIQALFQNTVVAESEHTEKVDGNHYFPPESLRREFFSDNAKTTVCGWKGEANYYDLEVNGVSKAAVAWTYRSPKAAAAQIKDHVAFYGDVNVVET